MKRQSNNQKATSVREKKCTGPFYYGNVCAVSYLCASDRYGKVCVRSVFASTSSVRGRQSGRCEPLGSSSRAGLIIPIGKSWQLPLRLVVHGSTNIK